MIKQDVDRTLQEHDYFLKKKTKEVLTECLFLWGKENDDYQYRQGMNEILAILAIVYDTERVSEETSQDWDTVDDSIIA